MENQAACTSQLAWRRLACRVAFASLVALSCACGQVVSGAQGDPGSVTQFEIVLSGSGAFEQWILLVVDDAPTEAARSLRLHLADDLRGFIDDLDAADCGIVADPAAYRPIDLRLVVVGASGTLQPRFRDAEGLHALGPDASPELLGAFEEAGRQAILATETAEVLPFVGEFEVAHYLNLLEEGGQPRSAAEAELATLLPSPSWPFIGLAKTRSDVSTNVAPVISSWGLEVSLLDWPEDGTCPEHPESRIDLPALDPVGGRWTSPHCHEEARIFEPGLVADCAPRCMSRVPLDASGRLNCRIYGDFPPDVDCQQSPGWTFVETTMSEVEGYENFQVNVCEMRQAEGAALDACINDFACEGCEPSFCFRRPFTSEDDDDPAHRRPGSAADDSYCETVRHTEASWQRLRFVHGVEQVGGFIRVVCQDSAD